MVQQMKPVICTVLHLKLTKCGSVRFRVYCPTDDYVGWLAVAASIVITVSCHKEHAELYYRAIVQKLYQTSDELVVQLVYVDNERPKRSRVGGTRLHNLMLIDSIEGFLAADIAFYTKGYNTNEFYYIFIQDWDDRLPDALLRIFDYCWRHMLINCSVQTQTVDGRLRLYTYYPYRENHCGVVNSVVINEFDRAAQRWQYTDYYHFFPLKVRNLHGCPLRVMIRHTPPFVGIVNGTHGSVYGLETQLLREIADYLNFTVTFQLIQLDDRTMNFCCGIIAALQNHETDIVFGYYRLRSVMMNISTAIFPYSMSTLISSVYRNAHNLTAWEKLLYPFDRTTWLWMGAAVASSYITAIVLRYHVMCGANYGTGQQLWLWTIATFLGIPLTMAPRAPHNRVLYASLLWMSFLLRSIYAALLYSLFRDDVKQILPDTTLALERGGYEAVLNAFTIIELTKLPNYGGFKNLHWTVINDSDEMIGYKFVEHSQSSKRYVVISAKEFLIYFAQEHRRPGAFHVLRENLHYHHFTAYVRKHSYLIRQLDATILRLNEVGLVDKWQEHVLDERYLHSRHLYGPQFIRQRDLNAIYAVVAMLLFGATLVFVGELRTLRNAKLRAIFDCIEQRQ